MRGIARESDGGAREGEEEEGGELGVHGSLLSPCLCA